MFLFSSVAWADTVNYGEELKNEPATSYQQKFTDVSKDFWAFSYIAELVEKGVISGYPDGTFRPNNSVSRAEFAKIMIGASGLKAAATNTSSFSDVKVTDWYCPYIETAKDFLNGYNYAGKTMYLPDTAAVREDIAIAMVKLKGYDTSVADLAMLKTMFSDYDSISESAKKYVAVAVQQGLVSGYDDGTFRAQKSITRAEAASLLWRASQYGNDNKIIAGDSPSTSTNPSSTSSASSGTSSNASTNSSTSSNTSKGSSTTKVSKPYSIDTIADAKVYKSTYGIYGDAIAISSDSIYDYENDKCIYKSNISSGKKEKLIDLSQWYEDQKASADDEDTDNVYNDAWKFKQIYYSESQDNLYLVLQIGNSKNGLFAYDNNKFHLVASNIKTSKILCDTKGSKAFAYNDNDMCFGQIDLATGSEDVATSEVLVMNAFNAKAKDGKIYLTYGESTANAGYYDFTDLTSVCSSESTNVFAFTDNFICFPGTSGIKRYSYTGTEKSDIDFDDVDVKDFTGLFSSSIDYMYGISDDEIIIYDSTAGSFRLLSKNK